MSDRRSTVTFSAYSASDEVPLDFAPIRAEARGRVIDPVEAATPAEQRSGLKLRFWFLLLALLGAAAIFVNQYRGVIVDLVAEYTHLLPRVDLPVLTLPELRRPVINRAINTVRMETALHNLTENEVRRVLARYTDSGFLGVDVQDLKAELEQNPWVAHASVRRVWPDILAVRIHEEIAVARWGDSALINDNGDVFVASLRESAYELPLVSGPDGTHRIVLEAFESFKSQLVHAELRLSAVHLDNRGSWTLETSSGLQIRLGRQLADQRLQRFVELYSRGLSQRLADAAIIDLRYTNGFSVSNRATATDAVASR